MPAPQRSDEALLPGLDQLDAHPGVRLLEALAEPRRDQRRQRHEAPQLERAAQLARELGREPLQLVGVTQQRPSPREELPPRRRRRDASRVMPDQQLHAEHRLELRQRRGHRRRRDRHILRGLRHAARITRRDEVLELAQGEPHPRIIVSTDGYTSPGTP